MGYLLSLNLDTRRRFMLSYKEMSGVSVLQKHCRRFALGLLSLSLLCTILLSGISANAEKANRPVVVLKTSLGDIRLELDAEKAPVTVENFLKYVKSGFYERTMFHRVIPGFMIQGGGFTSGMSEKNTYPPIKNEAANRLPNKRGTIAMARTAEVDSATSQFFINVADNSFLNYKGSSAQRFGYCVFGRVTQGMNIVDKIAQVKTHIVPPYEDVPVKDVLILKADILVK